MSGRCKDYNWKVSDDGGVHSRSVQHAQLAVLMDIRDELKELNATLACHNTRAIPGFLRRIARNTTKKKEAEMSLATLHRAIVAEAREVVKNRRLRLKDLHEWSTSEDPVRFHLADDEVALYLPLMRVWIAIPKAADKRKL